MFLCEKCGVAAGVQDFWYTVGPLSYGPCEDCKKTAPCLDCQVPNIARPKPKTKKSK